MPKDREESSTSQSSTINPVQMTINWIDMLNATQLREVSEYLQAKKSKAAKNILAAKSLTNP